MHFGFSYVGLIYLVMLFAPNIKWARNKPKDYDRFAKNENKILLMFERTGEILTCAIVLVFSDFNIHGWKWWNCWLIVSFVLMILYEMHWYRYFKSEKTMRDQYSSFCGFPVAGATLPVLAFFLLGIYGSNLYLIIATIILGISYKEEWVKNDLCRRNHITMIRLLEKKYKDFDNCICLTYLGYSIEILDLLIKQLFSMIRIEEDIDLIRDIFDIEKGH